MTGLEKLRAQIELMRVLKEHDNTSDATLWLAALEHALAMVAPDYVKADDDDAADADAEDVGALYEDGSDGDAIPLFDASREAEGVEQAAAVHQNQIEERAERERVIAQVHAAGFRAGAEAMQKMAAFEAAVDVIGGRKGAPEIAASILALPLPEPPPQPEAASPWRPIATAPRDGTPVLLWIPPCLKAVSGARLVASWQRGDWHTQYLTAPTLWAPLPELPEPQR
jgi:hypothetical protein